MPFYDLKCKCGHVTEFMMAPSDLKVVVECEECDGSMTRRKNRLFDVPMIQGDTVAGGVNYSYFDVNLQTQIKNKQHRQEVMREQGVRDYSPTTDQIRTSKEVKHIRENSTGKELEAAVRAELKTAQRAAQTKRVDESFAKYNRTRDRAQL